MFSFVEGAKTCWRSPFEEAEAGWKEILGSAASHGDKAEASLGA